MAGARLCRAATVAETPIPRGDSAISVGACINEITVKVGTRRGECCGRYLIHWWRGADRDAMHYAVSAAIIIGYSKVYCIESVGAKRMDRALLCRAATVAKIPTPGRHAAVSVGACIGEITVKVGTRRGKLSHRRGVCWR